MPYTDEDDATTTWFTPALRALLQDSEGAGGVRMVAGDRVDKAARDAAERGEVDHGVNTLEGAAEGAGVEDAALGEVDVQAGEVVPVPGREVIERRNLVAGVERGPGEVGADEPGSTGD